MVIFVSIKYEIILKIEIYLKVVDKKRHGDQFNMFSHERTPIKRRMSIERSIAKALTAEAKPEKKALISRFFTSFTKQIFIP
ncbi:MAG TPA: hypothetical protein PLH76_04425 [Rectinema sp.]|jgi:hypothetical protein|nr:hypothetical protein [Spirochaetaceae bacterium]HPN03243.1 hypothetical protein [Rectinema sp.]HQJ23297.1 hypothetical protein [Rectinema sp.]